VASGKFDKKELRKEFVSIEQTSNQ